MRATKVKQYLHHMAFKLLSNALVSIQMHSSVWLVQHSTFRHMVGALNLTKKMKKMSSSHHLSITLGFSTDVVKALIGNKCS